jgi:nucleoside-triphosphatase THEP1
MDVKKLILLTGEKQTGKTTALVSWIKHRENVAGILTPVVNGKRLFYSINDSSYYDMEAAPNEKNVLSVGKFQFSATAFTKTEELISAWSNQSHWNWIIIDEIGPLELVQQKGLYNSFRKLIQATGKYNLLIVVRPSLIQQVLELISPSSWKIEVINTDQLPTIDPL